MKAKRFVFRKTKNKTVTHHNAISVDLTEDEATTLMLVISRAGLVNENEGELVSALTSVLSALISAMRREHKLGQPDRDPVNHPDHYTLHPSGVECITVTEHMNFNLGNAVKYIWRAGLKGKQVQDLEKAIWYLQRELARIARGT